jgi:lysophospholipase L1-like esterase
MAEPRRNLGVLILGAIVAAGVGVAVFQALDRPVAVFLGDSYTVETSASTPDKTAAHLIADHYGWKPVNLARSSTGYITEVNDPTKFWCGFDHCNSYTQQLPDAAAADPDIVVVNGGRNELAIGASAEWIQGVDAFFTELRRSLPNATIIAASPIWDDDPTPPELDAMREVVRQAVTAMGGTYVDLGDPLLGHPDFVQADGIHPNDAGHAAIAAAFEAAYTPTA